MSPDISGEVVVLTLEESQIPQVTFDLSFRGHGDEGEVHGREKVTLKVNELTRVELPMGGDQWEAADLVVKASSVGYPEISKTATLELLKATSDLQVFFQTEKNEYSQGEIVQYRAVVVDANVDTPKFLQVLQTSKFEGESVAVGWVGVPVGGILRGSFAHSAKRNDLEVLVTSSVTSKPEATFSVKLKSKFEYFPGFVRVDLNMPSRVSFVQPKIKGSLTLWSWEGIPQEGHCEVTIRSDQYCEPQSCNKQRFLKVNWTKNFTLEGAIPAAQFELDVVEELGAVREEVDSTEILAVGVVCTPLLSGSQASTHRNLFLDKSTGKDGLPTDFAAFRLSPKLHVGFVDPTRSIRRGEVVGFFVRSCVSYGSANAVLSSSKEICSSTRFLFPPGEEGGQLNKVIDLTIPQNVSEGSLNLIVYGKQSEGRQEVHFASLQINLVAPGEQQDIQIVDKVDGDLSTSVTIRLVGLLKNSVVSLQATQFTPPDDNESETSRNRELSCVRFSNEDNEDQPDFDNVHLATSSDSVNKPKLIVQPKPRIIFFDMQRTSTEDTEFSIVNKTFDRITEFGSFAITASTYNSKLGKTETKSLVLKILPPPVTLSVSVPLSVLLGETLEVIGYVKKNLDAPFEGQVTLHLAEGGSTAVREGFVEINANSFVILKFQVTPLKIGDLQVSLQSNISSRRTATKKVKVNSPGVTFKFAKHFLIETKSELTNLTSFVGNSTFDFPCNCTSLGNPTLEVFENDIFRDISTFVHDDLFNTGTYAPIFYESSLELLWSLHEFYSLKNDTAASHEFLDLVENFGSRIYAQTQDDTVGNIANRLLIGTSIPHGHFTLKLSSFVMRRWKELTSMQQPDGSFIMMTSPAKKTRGGWDGMMRSEAYNKTLETNNLILESAIALFVLNKVDGYQLHGTNLTFPPGHLKRGVDFLKRMNSDGHLKDNLVANFVAFLLTEIKDPQAPRFLHVLKKTASRDSEGVFWKCGMLGNSAGMRDACSLYATSSALRTLVNLKRAQEASQVARWLVYKKNSKGVYTNWDVTASVVESLSKYAALVFSTKGEWPSVVRISQECHTPRKNISGGDELAVETWLGKSLGELRIRVCAGEHKLWHQRWMILEVSLPSGFLTKIWGRRSGRFVTFLPNRQCTQFTAYRVAKAFAGDLGKNPPKGSVTYYEFKDPLKRSVSFFVATQKEMEPGNRFEWDGMYGV